MSERQSFYLGVKMLILHNGKILILKEKDRDTWEIPGGRIDQGQTIEEAAARELGEEIAGAKLLSLGELVHFAVGDFMVENDHKLLLAFYASEAELPDEIALSDEHTEAAWIAHAELDQYKLFSSDRAAIELRFAGKPATTQP